MHAHLSGAAAQENDQHRGAGARVGIAPHPVALSAGRGQRSASSSTRLRLPGAQVARCAGQALNRCLQVGGRLPALRPHALHDGGDGHNDQTSEKRYAARHTGVSYQLRLSASRNRRA